MCSEAKTNEKHENELRDEAGPRLHPHVQGLCPHAASSYDEQLQAGTSERRGQSRNCRARRTCARQRASLGAPQTNTACAATPEARARSTNTKRRPLTLASPGAAVRRLLNKGMTIRGTRHVARHHRLLDTLECPLQLTGQKSARQARKRHTCTESKLKGRIRSGAGVNLRAGRHGRVPSRHLVLGGRVRLVGAAGAGQVLKVGLLHREQRSIKSATGSQS